jgi:hypothetical protein
MQNVLTSLPHFNHALVFQLHLTGPEGVSPYFLGASHAEHLLENTFSKCLCTPCMLGINLLKAFKKLIFWLLGQKNKLAQKINKFPST